MPASTKHPLADMLRLDREEWRALVAALDARPEGALHACPERSLEASSRRDPESPAWEVKDIYAHLARWITHSTDDLEARLGGRTIPTPEGTDNEINARWQAEDAALSLQEARECALAAFDRRIAALAAVPAERWDNTLIAVAHADGYEHYSGHRRYIEKR